MQSFPKPLSSKEEDYYLSKYEEGDPKAKNILIENGIRTLATVTDIVTDTSI